jgi:hypothetical protein
VVDGLKSKALTDFLLRAADGDLERFFPSFLCHRTRQNLAADGDLERFFPSFHLSIFPRQIHTHELYKDFAAMTLLKDLLHIQDKVL